MRLLAAAVLVSLAVAASAAEHWFEPVAPTTHSFVTLQARGVAASACVPAIPQVARSGNQIDVRLKTVEDCSGIAVPTGWSLAAPLGVLEAGVYDVTIAVDFEEPRHDTLVVQDAEPPFFLTEPIVTTSGGETTVWRDDPGTCMQPSNVTIGGVAVAVLESDCVYAKVAVPPHAAGAVDVTAKFGDATLTARAALRYVDPAAAADDSAFERILVPLLFEGAGAYGSQWVTEGRLVAGRPLRWFHDVVNAECATEPCDGENIDLMMRFGLHPAGLLLFVPREVGEVDAKLLVRDTSREHESFGSQVPVVREEDFVREGAMRFPAVPFGGRYRALLRIYGVDAATSRVLVVAGSAARHVTLAGACGFHVTPCNSARPAFAAVDLNAAFPELAGRQDVSVLPALPGALRYWSFVSVTNNDTQFVTVMTP